MELRQLVVYCELAEEMHFGRTAEALQMAQSSVSQHVRRLEKELGVRLIHRTTRKMEFTPAGQLFLDEARAILRRVERAAQATKLLAGQHEGTLSVGTNFPAGRTYVPRLLTHLRQMRPGLTVSVQELGSADQEEAVLGGDLDIGLIYGPPSQPGLDSSHLGDVELAALVRHDHPLVASGYLDLRQISRYPFITGSAGSTSLLGQHIWEAARAVGARLGPASLASANLYLDLATSDAIAFASQPRCEQGVASGLVTLEIVPPLRPLPLHLIWCSGADDQRVNIVRTFFDASQDDPQEVAIDRTER